MRNAGYQSFQIQTRLSFSDDYLAMCRLAADEAASRGMMIGIYDEYNWLSGHAGGLTVQGRDELRERHLFHVTVPVGASGRIAGAITGIRSQDIGYLQEPGRQWVYDGGEPLWDEWTLVGAIGVTADGLPVDLTAGAHIDRADPQGCATSVDVPPAPASCGPGAGPMGPACASCCSTTAMTSARSASSTRANAAA